MKFSRLKLHGFKSFCDHTDLHLETGLTGVVGPNGCGKSNLVEALRWVMGESSYKAMRASGMDDVIFAGSATRPARNSAEVTLVLDNSGHTAPALFNKDDTLEVTRRIEREAGSVYRVNGREVRARDVQLLFADASTGAKSPALVRQGQIGELIAAKPNKRRALLEEAAGISGLHSRRHEAELRLRAAELNLERVDDIVAQVETQLDTLKRQARLAVRFRSISGHIRKAEATLYHVRWVAARFAEKEAEAEQGRLVGRLAGATHADHEATKALEAADLAQSPLREAEAKAGAVLQRLTIVREQLEAEAHRAGARQAELLDREKQITADGGREQALVAESEAAIAERDREQAGLNAEAKAESGALDKARQEAGTAGTALAKLETDAHQAADGLAQLRARRAQALRAAEDAQKRATRLEKQVLEVEAEGQQVHNRLEADETIRLRRSELDAARDAAAKAEAKALKAEDAAGTAQQALDAAGPALGETETELGRLESEAATLARVLDLSGGALWPPVADALSVKNGFEVALGAALGDDLEASTDSGAPLHWMQGNAPANGLSLPEGAEPLSRFVTGVPALGRRLDQVGLVKEEDGARLMARLHPGQRLVSKDGALWRWDGFVAKADAPTAAAQRLAQRHRLTELDAEIAQRKNERVQRKEKRDGATATLAARRQDEKSTRSAWRATGRAIETAQAGLALAQKSLTDLASRQSALAEARVRLKSSLADARDVENDARTALGDMDDEETMRADVEALQEALRVARGQTEEARVRLGGFENAARLREERLTRITSDLDGLKRRRDGAHAQLQTLDRRAKEIRAQLDAVKEAPGDFARRRETLDGEIAGARTGHQAASDALTRAQAGYRDADKAVRSAVEALGAVRAEIARLEERLKGAAAQRQQIEQAVAENLGISAARTAEAAGLKPEAPLPGETHVERRVERLKAERERLGGVNLGAEREAEDIREKLETMIADREDLVAAIAKLRTGISSLDREGRARLTAAFEVVNAHFKELFVTLFGGGEASLSFVESDDPLHAGLEIIARPPGKKAQTMTLLSGGEQALTAMALIFAVFLTNPAPVCVLDEVDAPLDDANVERFCNLLDNMRARTDTRFMVITHNPITMSRVDRLFGVTMGEKGVSQLVSVDLSGASDLREAG